MSTMQPEVFITTLCSADTAHPADRIRTTLAQVETLEFDLIKIEPFRGDIIYTQTNLIGTVIKVKETTMDIVWEDGIIQRNVSKDITAMGRWTLVPHF